MHHADRPYQARRLAGVDQALGDGRAREPADLLNQLRERLDSLAANHPSAHADRSQPAEADEQPQGDATELPEDSGSGEADSRRRRDEPRGPERREQSQPPGHGETQAFTEAFGEASVGNGANLRPESAIEGHSAPPDWARTHGIFPAQSEPYRPWFAADGSGEPWFVE